MTANPLGTFDNSDTIPILRKCLNSTQRVLRGVPPLAVHVHLRRMTAAHVSRVTVYE